MMVVLAFLVMVVMVAAALLLILVVMVVVLVLLFFTVMVVMMLFLVQALGLQPGKLRGQGGLAFHSGDQLFSGELAPGGGDDGGNLVVLPQQLHGGIQLGLGHRIGTGENDGRGGLHLVVVELAKILGVDLDLACVYHGHGIAQGHVRPGDLVHGTDHIGELTHAGGLNDDPVRVVLRDHLFQRLAEVAHQRAADAAGIHFRNIDARILEEAAVNADLTEFIFDQHQLLALIPLLDHFLDEGGFTGTQEAGVDVYFGHL